MAKALSLPMVVGAVVIGVISGKMLFGPPLEEYWSKKLKEEASKETPPNNTTSPDSTTS
ncbi:hypothetical protein FCM35_KLT01454 [Carex littledalei]|uniref:Transmembrane protein n=1 Tax=Carex littledalei TaxID=544730 RepID=A0A833VSU7_9POAL|nr:hypothetical protein FCM35_KLT22433 [Carex littledalei]KAF3333763.1 hypothetical protein FCM35_KLT01454 [Carex littledalei]